jgi:hypothetical protein
MNENGHFYDHLVLLLYFITNFVNASCAGWQNNNKTTAKNLRTTVKRNMVNGVFSE